MNDDGSDPGWSAAAQAMMHRAVGDGSQAFGSFFLSRLLGLEISYEDERCIVMFEATPPLFNPQRTLHGGVLATALDISMGHLLHRQDGPGTTLEMKVQYLGAITGGTVRCEASFLRRGGGICFLQSHAWDADRKLAAHATATWKRLRRPT